MNMKMEIICENFEQKQIVDNKILVDEQSSEYYVIPLNKEPSMEYDDEVFKLTFKNQLLWLKYSNHRKEILIKEYDFNECVLIKSEDILDIYVKIQTSRYDRKNVWHSYNNVNMNKKYLGRYFIVVPVIDDMIDVHEWGIGIKNYQIRMITNEILLKPVLSKNNNHGYVGVTNNVMLNKSALFILLDDDEVSKFLESF